MCRNCLLQYITLYHSVPVLVDEKNAMLNTSKLYIVNSTIIFINVNNLSMRMSLKNNKVYTEDNLLDQGLIDHVNKIDE